MSFNNFLTSGIAFDASEENLVFRFRLLNAVMLVAICSTLTFVLLDQFGINSLGDRQLFVTQLFALVSFIQIVWLRGRKWAYAICAWITIITAYLTFTSALVNVLNDEFRMIWYYILVVCAYLLLEPSAGIVATVASFVTIASAKYGFDIAISDNAFFTFILSLAVTSGITYAYTRLANSYFERMTRNYEQLRDLASKDPLTGLWNARAFYDMSNKLIQVARRTHQSFCTLFIDLDHFKSINDQYGHEAGDAVLRAVAGCLSGNVRQSDIVGRIGGEEFVVFLPNTEVNGALQLAEKLRSSAAALRHSFPGGEQRAVTLSIGVAQSVELDRSVADIQKRADTAMYDAKKQGRNRIALVAAVAG